MNLLHFMKILTLTCQNVDYLNLNYLLLDLTSIYNQSLPCLLDFEKNVFLAMPQWNTAILRKTILEFKFAHDL